MAHKYKYCVMFAYLCTSENKVKFEYVENIACNKKEAMALTVIEVTREYEVRE